MAKNKKEEVVVSDEVIEVKEENNTVLTVNPYVEYQVHIHGLDRYVKNGLRVPAGKTVRAWIRARGLSVSLPGVSKETLPNEGTPFKPKDSDVEVTPDLIIYRFDEDCLIAANAEVVVPQNRTVKVEVPDEITETTAAAAVAEDILANLEDEENVLPKDW